MKHLECIMLGCQSGGGVACVCVWVGGEREWGGGRVTIGEEAGNYP